jgi:DNA (cytosine-5)-methyltransferase 1
MHYGVPQSRERVIIVGTRNDLGIIPSFPRPQTEALGLRSALGLRRGWGKLGDGVKNKQFNNAWRSLDLPCVTLEKTRPPILNIGGKERELTLAECATVASFPPDFKWGSKAYQCIGNSVPPLLMKAIAAHIRSEILNRISIAEIT